MAGCKLAIQEYVELSGCDVETGSVVAVALIDESIDFDNGINGGTLDITDPANWTNLVYATDILIYDKVRGSYAKPAIAEVAGKGSQQTKTVGRNHELVFRVNAIKGNHNHWNNLNKSDNYKLAFVVGGGYDILFFVDVNVHIDAGPEVQEGLDTEVDWMVSIKWSDIDLPTTHDVPVGIFN